MTWWSRWWRPKPRRSPRWAAVRAAHLRQHPQCAACGSTQRLEVHHERPVHLYPELELAVDNLITLCEGEVCNCHLVWGHLGRWDCWNPFVRLDAGRYADRKKNRLAGKQ